MFNLVVELEPTGWLFLPEEEKIVLWFELISVLRYFNSVCLWDMRTNKQFVWGWDVFSSVVDKTVKSTGIIKWWRTQHILLLTLVELSTKIWMCHSLTNSWKFNCSFEEILKLSGKARRWDSWRMQTNLFVKHEQIMGNIFVTAWWRRQHMVDIAT